VDGRDVDLKRAGDVVTGVVYVALVVATAVGVTWCAGLR